MPRQVTVTDEAATFLSPLSAGDAGSLASLLALLSFQSSSTLMPNDFRRSADCPCPPLPFPMCFYRRDGSVLLDVALKSAAFESAHVRLKWQQQQGDCSASRAAGVVL